MQQEPWVAMASIAEHLDVSQDTVRRWIKNRGMPAHKVGRAYRFKVTEVDEWVRTHEATQDE
jgi:excisionase family DNA binding protein